MRFFPVYILFLMVHLAVFSQEVLLESLKRAQLSGDYQQILNLKDEIRNLLAHEEDPVMIAALSRALWIDTISTEESGLFDPFISSLESLGDDVWIGTRSGDIARYSLSERTWFILKRGVPSLAIRSVNAIKADRDRVWVLSYGSVLMYDMRTGRTFSPDLPDHSSFRGMQSLSLLGRGILVGTQGAGLRRILLEEETVIPHSILKNVTFLFQADNDRLFAGTEEKGLFLVDAAGKVKPVVENNRRTAGVRAMLPYDESSFIAGSYGNGLFLLTEEHGLFEYERIFSPAIWITGGVETNRGYCFSTLGNGLIYMDGTDLTQHHRGIAEGLPTLDITAVDYSAPYIICGTQDQGLLVVHEDFFK